MLSAQVVLRTTELRNLMGVPSVVHRSDQIFNHQPYDFLNPYSPRETVLEMLSSSCFDSKSLQFWVEKVSAFSSRAAEMSQFESRSRGIRMLIDIYLYSGHPRYDVDGEVVQKGYFQEEIDDTLIFNTFGDGEGVRGGGASGSAIKKLGKLIYENGGDGFREKECHICLEVPHSVVEDEPPLPSLQIPDAGI